MIPDATLRLKPQAERSVVRRHPWIFSGAIAAVSGDPKPGQTVRILASNGACLGRAAFSPASQIAARMWTFDEEEAVDRGFFRRRLAAALAVRGSESDRAATAARRLVYSEADGLPGLVVDRYADYLVCQFLSAGAEAWKREVVLLLQECVSVAGIYERSDGAGREKEGLPVCTGLLAGSEPPDRIEIQEGPCRFLIDVRRGHKTGFYLDQRENRAHVAACSAGREVLNAYAYTGGFGVAALVSGAARVIHVDTSAATLDLARRNAELNGLESARVEYVEADVPILFRKYRDAGRQFDGIVLDPPKFAASRSQVASGVRGYKDINLFAFKLLRPGGLLFTFSCSAHVDADLFQQVVAGAALDSGRTVRILRRLGQAPDHPTAINVPESAYLKGLVCHVE